MGETLSAIPTIIKGGGVPRRGREEGKGVINLLSMAWEELPLKHVKGFKFFIYCIVLFINSETFIETI